MSCERYAVALTALDGNHYQELLGIPTDSEVDYIRNEISHMALTEFVSFIYCLLM